MKRTLTLLLFVCALQASAGEMGWSGDTQWFRSYSGDFKHDYGELSGTALCPWGNWDGHGSCFVGNIWGWPYFSTTHPTAPAGCLVYGPYQDFTGKGTIHGLARLRRVFSTKKAPGDPAFRVDIASKGKILAQRWILTAEATYKSMEVSLTVPNAYKEDAVEMRICDLKPNTQVLVESTTLYFTYVQ